jgi:hypothetical protein
VSQLTVPHVARRRGDRQRVGVAAHPRAVAMTIVRARYRAAHRGSNAAGGRFIAIVREGVERPSSREIRIVPGWTDGVR